MPNAASLTPESRFMSLFVGPKHSGKTVAACSWLSTNTSKRLKVLDVDGRIKGIQSNSWLDLTRIDYDYFPPRVLEKDKTFFERVNSELEALKVLIDTHKCAYETYVVDSATAVARNLVQDAIPITHAQGKGSKIGVLEIAGPQDYNFEITGMANLMSFLKALPLNIIVTAHIEDKWDKPKDDFGNRLQYADSIVVGEKLALRPKVESVLSLNFDHIFRFDRQIIDRQEQFFVEYVGELACTSFPGLKPGKHNITGRNFREFTLDLVNKTRVESEVAVK